MTELVKEERIKPEIVQQHSDIELCCNEIYEATDDGPLSACEKAEKEENWKALKSALTSLRLACSPEDVYSALKNLRESFYVLWQYANIAAVWHADHSDRGYSLQKEEQDKLLNISRVFYRNLVLIHERHFTGDDGVHGYINYVMQCDSHDTYSHAVFMKSVCRYEMERKTVEKLFQAYRKAGNQFRFASTERQCVKGLNAMRTAFDALAEAAEKTVIHGNEQTQRQFLTYRCFFYSELCQMYEAGETDEMLIIN